MRYTDNQMLWGKFIKWFGSFHDISTPVGQVTSDLNEIFMSVDLDVSVICVNVCVFIIFTFRVTLFEILSFFKFWLAKKNILIVILIKTEILLLCRLKVHKKGCDIWSSYSVKEG
jgi:hypothetical protein